MPDSSSTPSGHALSPQIPAVIFANWREMVNREMLTQPQRREYAEAIST